MGDVFRSLPQVEDLLTSFWKSLQRETVVLMSLPDVCQLFKCYDVQMYKVERCLFESLLCTFPEIDTKC